MKKEYNAPEIYVEETFILPKSVVQVETAIPAFIGFTEKAVFKGQNLHLKIKKQPVEVNSFSEFEIIFGGPPDPSAVDVELDSDNSVSKVRITELSFLYYSVKLFFDNGGGTCLVVSVGNYDAAASKGVKRRLLGGLFSLEKTDAPTLLVIPDAVKLSYPEAGEVHTAMLAQSCKLNNRFALLDLVNGSIKPESPGNQIEQFRNNLGIKFLSHGAAYYPWLTAAYTRQAGSRVILSARYFKNGKLIDDLTSLFRRETIDLLRRTYSFDAETGQLNQSAPAFVKNGRTLEALATALYDYLKRFYNLKFNGNETNNRNPDSVIHKRYVSEGSRFHGLVNRLHALFMVHNLSGNENLFSDDFKPLVFPRQPVFLDGRNNTRTRTAKASLKLLAAQAEQLIIQFDNELELVRKSNRNKLKQSDVVYQMVVDAVESQNIVLPPCGAVAGIITKTDREQGVWKAPANVSINAVLNPTVEITHHEQEFLKTDPAAGKSINAIRMFAGRGVLIWGARTLAGNDNEWRYIQVRRLFIMVELSVKEAIKPFVFEPNNSATWQKVAVMVENFLVTLWKAGALQGTKPGEAFFVRTGLGQTMTASDISNGIMILEIGLAVIRPAEFVILRISHKMQLT